MIKKRNISIFVGLVIIISRFLFFDGTPDYFDATQYLWRTNLGTLLDSLSTGHAPYHPGYLFFSYYFQHIFRLFRIDNLEIAATLPAVIFGALALWFFYLLSLRLTKNYLAAAIATLCATFAPYFWLGSISILIDPVMWGGYLIGLYFWLRYFETKKIGFSFLAGLGLDYLIKNRKKGIFVIPIFAVIFIWILIGIGSYFLLLNLLHPINK